MKRGALKIEPTLLMNQTLTIALLSASLTFSAVAAPLDNQIEKFKDADVQTENAVAQILKSGLNEKRSAMAFAAVKPWLSANPSSSQEVLFTAAQAAEYSGDWTAAVSFYRKLLKMNDLDAGRAAIAVPSCYRLLINTVGDADSAYLLMREDGDKLRKFGNAKTFDDWFLNQAKARADLLAACRRMEEISKDESVDLNNYKSDLIWICKQFEDFKPIEDDYDVVSAKLVASPRIDPVIKARLDWAVEVVKYNKRLDLARNAKMDVRDGLADDALSAAAELLRVAPDQGAFLVAQGWGVEYDDNNSGNCQKRFEAHKDQKLNQLISVIPMMSPKKRDELLGYPFALDRVRFSPNQVLQVLTKFPETLNQLDSFKVSLYSRSLTQDQAKTLSPLLAKNPHPDAAFVRAYATSGKHKITDLLPSLMKSELWRFADSKSAAEALWNSGADRDKEQIKSIQKTLSSAFDRNLKIKKQIAKKSPTSDRLAAFDALRKEMLSNNPSTPGLLDLWKETFEFAPDADQVTMIQRLLKNTSGENEVVLRNALNHAAFGQKRIGRMPWQADVYGNHFKYHQNDTRKSAEQLIKELEGMVVQQAKSGQLNETVFGMWIHAVNPRDEEAIKVMQQVIASPGFAKLDSSYRRVATDGNHFRTLAKADPNDLSRSNVVSRELHALTDGATPQQVEGALAAVISRVKTAPAPVAVTDVGPVANLPDWSDQTLDQVLSLFRENAPLGDYPIRTGYEKLINTTVEQITKRKDFGRVEPYVAGMWNAAKSTDDGRHHRASASLAKLAQSALDAGNASIAMTIVRSGLNSQVQKQLATSNDDGPKEALGRLKQVAGKAAVEVGAIEIPVDETNPAYAIYKSNSEFAQDNLDSAWSLYTKNEDQLKEVLRKLPAEYGLWLLKRNIETNRTDQAEDLVKELTIWSRQAAGTFSSQQDAQLKIAYADLAFRKGALPTARAWYRKVADAAEYKGSEMHVNAALGSVMVDRVSRNFSAAMTELDKLILLKNPAFRSRIRYARAEVFMDQESFAEALEEVEAVLRQETKHPDALILRGKIQYEMRKLVEASEIELGPTQDNTVIVPGETVKINLRDPTLSVSGVGAEIEVEIWAKSGDKERVLLYQLGDSKERFRAEVPTALGPPTPGDKVLQILGEDEIRFGYSKRFRDKMDDLPADPDVVIGVASDAYLSFSAGAFPPREGERRLNIEELGLSSAQAALGTRAVRPGNPVYVRVTDLDQSLTSGVDQITVALQSSSGDVIRRLVLDETRPYSGEFEAIVPTTGAQALAFASESAPGRDPNMAISSKDYPGWQGELGDQSSGRIYGIDLNDSVGLGTMTVDMGGQEEGLTHFVLQTSMNGKDWETRHRFPDHKAPWDGRPRLTSFPTYRNGVQVPGAKDYNLPKEWAEAMELKSISSSVNYLAGYVKNISDEKLPIVNTGHPNYSGMIQYRALFYQPAAAIRTFKLTGYPMDAKAGSINTIFLLDGAPAAADSDDPFTITRELKPGLHEIQVWRNEGKSTLEKRKPVILCDVPGKDDLVPCPDKMFDPSTFPEGVRKLVPQPADIRQKPTGELEVSFAENTNARLVRFVIYGFKGVAPQIKKITLSGADGSEILPVQQDYKALRENEQLEVLPGDTITVRYEDPISATPKRNRHEKRLSVAFNDATITASFLNYEINKDGERVLMLEPIRRFRFDDAVGLVIDDADMDGSEERDIVDITVTSSDGQKVELKAVETEVHSGRFICNVFPVKGAPTRKSEIQMPVGGSLTASYRDAENLSPGIPTDRIVKISHAQYQTPVVDGFTILSEDLNNLPVRPKESEDAKPKRGVGPETVRVRRSLSYEYIPSDLLAESQKIGLIGAPLCFDVVAPHLALAKSSEIRAYVQTEAARKAAKIPDGTFDVRVPGTLKLSGKLGTPKVAVPQSYSLSGSPKAPTNSPPLEEGRFSFSVPLILGNPPERSFAVKSAEELPSSMIPEGLAVKAGDIVHVGYPWQDEENKVHWYTMKFIVGSNAFLDVMENGYTANLFDAFVGEKVYLRLIAPGLDRGPERDAMEVTLKGTSGAGSAYQLRETEAHSGIFKGAFTISYADKDITDELPPIELNGFPVRYGDSIKVSYQDQSFEVSVNKGADGLVEPFSKRFTGDEMAVRTGFTLAECYFELAKKHREMDQEALARREIGHARKLLAEALANHQDDELKAHAEYLLGNLSQEFADIAKNDEAKLPMYQDALARFSKIPTDYPETEFASKAQFKTALVYEKMGEIENSVEEYVKLAYKYPDDELIPTVMSRLGGYFQTKGMAFKNQADPFRKKEDDASQAEVLKFDELSYPEFLNAAMVFTKLQERFPDDPLSGLAGLRAGQNFMRAHQYENAIAAFDRVTENEQYDGRDVRSQALYWKGLCYERLPHRPEMRVAYQIYRRVTFDFPDSKWAKYARGRLADPAFERIIEEESSAREKMIDALKESKK